MRHLLLRIALTSILASGFLAGCGEGLQTFSKYGISFEVSEELKLEEGDKVNITTESGQSQTTIKSLQALKGNSARLFPNCKDILLLTGRINPDLTLINARIEKI